MKLNRLIYLVTTSLILHSCAGLQKMESFRIQSDLAEVSLYSSEGELIGKTPLELSPEQMQKLSLGEDHFQFVARKEGYVDGQYSLVLTSPTTIKISLKTLSSEHFNQWVLKKYSRETNKMLKEILEIQSLVFSADRTQLEARVAEFNQHYQNIAPAYTLQGSVYLREGRVIEARQSLDRALSIDPEDLTAKRLIEELERGNK